MRRRPAQLTRYFLCFIVCAMVIGSSVCVQAERWRSYVLRPPVAPDRYPVVTAVALRPEHEHLAAAGDDHLVRVWNFQTRELVHTLDGHSDWVRDVAYSPDGRLLISAGNDRRIIVWDAALGTRLRLLQDSPAAVAAVAFSPDGQRVAAAGFDSFVRVYDPTDGRETLRFACPCGDMRAVAFSPAGDRLAAAGRSGAIRVWDLQSGAVLMDRVVHRDRVHSLAFCDGDRVISASQDRTVRRTSISEPEQSLTLTPSGCKVLALAICGPKRLATAGSDNLVRLWDLETGKEIQRLAGHTGSVACLTYDQDLLVSGSFDTTLRVWNAADRVADADAGAPGLPALHNVATPVEP